MLGVMLSLHATNSVNQWFLLHVSCTPPPPCPTNTVSNEHYPFEPYFLFGT